MSPFPDSVYSNFGILENSTKNYDYQLAFQPCPYRTTNYTYGCYCYLVDQLYFQFDKWLCQSSNFKNIKIAKVENTLIQWDYA